MNKLIDRILRAQRMGPVLKASKVLDYPPANIFDLGCDDNFLLKKFLGKTNINLVGMDKHVQGHHPAIKNIEGTFPQDLPAGEQQNQYDLIFAVAVIEHLPEAVLPTAAATLAKMIAPQGRLIVTVPHHRVDSIIHLLTNLHLINPHAAEEHHRFNAASLPSIMAPFFILEKWKKFQMGMNNLMVFRPKLTN